MLQYLLNRLYKIRHTVVIILVIVVVTIAVLYVLRFLPGAEFIEQDRLYEEAHRPREINTSSPVYAYAKDLAGRYKIVQCDGNPSVQVGKQTGYRILLQREWHERQESNGDVKYVWNRFHKDLILVPVVPLQQPRLDQITWEYVEQYIAVEPVSMGQGHGYHWFGRMLIPDQDLIRKKLDLMGGDDRLALLMKHLDHAANKEERRWRIYLLAKRMGEQAFPVVKREIEQGYPGSYCHGISALMYVPGKESTDLLLSLYDDEKTRRIASYVLINSIRIEAKRVYFDILREDTPDVTKYRAALEAVRQYDLKEAVPLLKKMNERPYLVDDYVRCSMVIRSLNDNPLPIELIESKEVILNMYDWRDDHFTNPVDVERALTSIQNHHDINGALLVSLSLATNNWKRKNYNKPSEAGIKALLALPRDQVLPLLEHLAVNIYEPRARENVVKILESVRSGQVQ